MFKKILCSLFILVALIFIYSKASPYFHIYQINQTLKKTDLTNEDKVGKYTALAHCYRQLHNYKLAEENLKKAMAISSNDVGLRVLLSILYIENNELNKAFKLMSEINDEKITDFDKQVKYCMLFFVKIQQDDYDTAKQIYKIIKLNSKNDKNSNKFFEYVEANKIETLKNNIQFELLMIKLVEPAFNLDADKDVIQARLLYKAAENENEAVKFYTKAIEKYPKEADLYYERGLCYIDLHQNDLAIEDCSKAIELNPSLYDAYALRANAYNEIGKAQEALHDINFVLEKSPDEYYDIRISRIISNIILKKYDDAMKDADYLINVKKDDDAYFYKAMIFCEKKDIQNCISYTTKSLKNDSSTPDMYMYRAAAYLKTNEIQKALKDLYKLQDICKTNQNKKMYEEVGKQIKQIKQIEKERLQNE